MGASLIDLKKRIDSTKKTKQITKAMQMVSAAKLSRAEKLVRDYYQYSNRLSDIVNYLSRTHLLEQLADRADEVAERDYLEAFYELSSEGGAVSYHDLLIERPIKKTGYLVIASDEGLAGSYNSSIFQATNRMLKEEHASQDEFVLLTISDAAKRFFEQEGYQVAYSIPGLTDLPTFAEVHSIVVKAVKMFRDGDLDEFYVCHNHHVNALLSDYRVIKMLPLWEIDPGESMSSDFEQDYIFEPSPEIILETILPQYAESLIYGSIVDAKASEHASRMTAMTNATDNAEGLINQLTRERNQKRQEQITQEITEIVGGAAALED